MGSIILCHKKKAKQPYEITRVHRNIYTMEELCYYLCNYLYLVDDTIVNEQLCDWIDRELELVGLAEKLRRHIEGYSSQEQFVMTILSDSGIYTASELKNAQDVMDKLKNQKPIEKQKHKADSLLESGAIKQAIFIYQSILQKQEDDSADKKFYGRVYGCLGTAYGRLFLYKEAADMFEKSYEICQDETILKAYLYACKKYLSDAEYQMYVHKNDKYQKLDMEISDVEQNLSQMSQDVLEADALENWKEQYRKNG